MGIARPPGSASEDGSSGGVGGDGGAGSSSGASLRARQLCLDLDRLSEAGLLVSLRTRSLLKMHARASAAVEWLHSLSTTCDGMCRLVCEVRGGGAESTGLASIAGKFLPTPYLRSPFTP